MRFALLGNDDDATGLAQAVVADHDHDLIRVCEVDAAAWEQLPAGARSLAVGDWESLLDSTALDAVIVARAADEEVRLEQLRKLIQSGVALVISHPVLNSVLGLYELEMMREEAGAVVLPYLPGRWHPALERVKNLSTSETDVSLGRLEQVVLERTGNDRMHQAVRSRFMHDVDLLRALCGEITKVGAMSSEGSEPFDNLGVQLSGPRGVLIRWSSGPAETRGGAVMTLRGSKNTAVLEMPEVGRPWQLEIGNGGQSHRESFDSWDAPAEAIARLDRAGRGEPVVPNLLDAVRTLEAAEAIDRSLSRGRTVELQAEEQSEGDAFRGTMASLGCAALGGGFAFALLALLLATLSEAFRNLMGFWPYLVALVLGLFLLLQLFVFFLPREEK